VVLKEVILLQGLVACYFNSWLKGINFYKRAADLAMEISNQEMKKVAYTGLAKCYQECKNYKVAVRCYKKLLQAAWDTEDTETEL
jgi:tetratricopeptide (TPR) repeat protein